MAAYRTDIDGLRGVSVLAVILFHSELGILPGGYIGVDVFFVISGFLITSLIYDEIESGTFSYINFYKRRIARLLPALVLLLVFVFMFGLVFYDNQAFDNLGKEIFYSTIGAANILFANGVNYFAQETALRPLIHLWSLGVEEQFYLVWPTLLLLLARLNSRKMLLIVVVFFFVSLYMASVTVKHSPMIAYFHPQYRAFELLSGAFVALIVRDPIFTKIQIGQRQKEIISYVAIALIIVPMFVLTRESTFPGINTLYPCIGTALYIAFSSQTRMSKMVGCSSLVLLGLISYPLYLYHQPIISYLHFFGWADNNLVVLFVTLIVSVPLSWLTYQFVERPIRRLAHKKSDKSAASYVMPLISSLAVLAIFGVYVAKNDGIGERFKILNHFSYQVVQNNQQTFHTYFKQGIQLSHKNQGKTLFIGDSVLQQYVLPISKALNLEMDDIDTVTRRGCVLLKGVEFQDIFSGISCNDLREKLYKLDTHYENVVISQSWDSYTDDILNFKDVDNHIDHYDGLSRWAPFISATIEHFKSKANRIILIGEHLAVSGTSDIRPTVFLSEEKYESGLKNLYVSNKKELQDAYSFFNRWSDDAFIIHPFDVWSENNKVILHNKLWSYFSDHQHATTSSTIYLEKKMREIFAKSRCASVGMPRTLWKCSG